MLSIVEGPLLLLLFIGYQICFATSGSYESQLLDCLPTKSTGAANRHPEPCGVAQGDHEVAKGKDNSSQDLGTRTDTKLITNLLSINFKSIFRRQAQDNCTGLQKISAGVVCAPNNSSSPQQSPRSASIDLYILTNDQNDANVHRVDLGSTSAIRCRFRVSPELTSSNDLSFKLRWLRSVASSQGNLRNQSIVADDHRSPNQHRHQQVTISTNRIWTLQRDGGLDLFLDDIESGDSGDYFCQAISDVDSSILDERRVRVIAQQTGQTDYNKYATPNFAETDAAALYSAEALEKLMPSLRIYPEYSELAYGSSAQLACVTSALDPDPEPNRIEWHFEPFKRPGYGAVNTGRDQQQEGVRSFGLPANTSQHGNILIIWSTNHDTIGVYKCSLHLADFNLTAEASAELAMRPSVDSAPLVYMTPELLRLSANGSAKVQCESTGYPAPTLEWYRVETAQSGTAVRQNGSDQYQSAIEQLDGLQVLRLQSQDAMAYCLENGCRALDNLDPQSRHQKHLTDNGSTKTPRVLVTGLSWIQISGARAHHQGQYVCKASNKHGSNQASSIVDVEFKELPVVVIDEEHRKQTIVLESTTNEGSLGSDQLRNVSFRCSIKSGQPKPRLKWLRASGLRDARGRAPGDMEGSASSQIGVFDSGNVPTSQLRENFDFYDLTRVSSATSKVNTHFEGDARTLVLQLSTISVDDEGDYVCLGENELGTHSAGAQLVVRKLPQVRILQTSPKVFRPNESFQLDCLVTGHPSPIDIEWSRSDRGAYFSLISRHSPSLSAHQERAILKFDRTTPDEAGEYTCAARDPLDEFNVLRDTIMLLAEEDQQGSRSAFDGASGAAGSVARHVPKLLVRPTKVTAEEGSNITLDCLAVSGLQPTVVEWTAPASAVLLQSSSPSNQVRSYYRSPLIELTHGAHSSPDALLQFGSKLRLFNVSRAHEGVYQCKGRNKAGIENAPALVTIVDRVTPQSPDGLSEDESARVMPANGTVTKTKIARMGTNIELRCQVNGVDEQPATSWSREGRQLPQGSVQIDHNLWIQNLTKADEGLYLCSVRSTEPNEIIQAKIKLLVQEHPDSSGRDKVGRRRYTSTELSAKIVASKSNLNVGDSVTLECIISFYGNASNPPSLYSSRELDNLERQVIWTNLHSGQSLFQENVYIQSNLLIIYDLKLENTATYRCNYNELSQYADYKLQISLNDSHTHQGATAHADAPVTDRDSFGSMITNQQAPSPGSYLANSSRIRHIQTHIGAKLLLECPEKSSQTGDKYYWTRGRGPLQSKNSSEPARWRTGREMEPLVLNPVETSHAGLYQCSRQLAASSRFRIEMHFLVEVQVVSAKFVQRPVSFVTLPAVSDADHQLELELKFFPEHDHGLMLFSGAVLANTLSSGLASSGESGLSTNQQNNKSLATLTSADYISLGLVRGHLEFRFELGDGVTLLRSGQPVQLNQWHRVLIERNRRGATMWLDGQPPHKNSSTGKFFNLNLDSLLYVGGHQIFLTVAGLGEHQKRRNSTATGQQAAHARTSFFGFARGFQGCISHLSVNGRELNLMSRNRSVAMGIFECDRPECSGKQQLAELSDDQLLDCSAPNGFCQVDRSAMPNASAAREPSGTSASKRLRSRPSADLRCVCAPGFAGPSCKEAAPPHETDDANLIANMTQQSQTTAHMAATSAPPQIKPQPGCDQNPEAKCNSTGTGQCQSLSSTTFRCHCKSGFMGELCDEVAAYTSETSLGFNQPAYVQLSFNSGLEVSKLFTTGQRGNGTLSTIITSDTLNETEFARVTTFTESQNISFKVQTLSSYGLLFYVGQISSLPTNEDGSYKMEFLGNNHLQTSKSVVANLLARLSTRKVGDFLAIALVDGHIELSYELGSGLAILRSSRRINDGDWHRVAVARAGKASKLTIDDDDKHEAHSPGKLSMLNVAPDIYLGGLPTPLQAAISSSSSSGSLLSTFQGCLSSLQINSLGPINLIRDDHLTRVKSARNLVPCNNGLLARAPTSTLSPVPGDKISIDQAVPSRPTTQALQIKKTTRKPTKLSHNAESDDDDSDEQARRSS